ncbi:MAG: HemK2/MTQ2 family protein methyltransferase [Chloroflexota bacterium]
MIRRVYRKLLARYAQVAYRHRHRTYVMEHVQDRHFVVLPDVFNPVLFRSGVFLIEQLPHYLQPHHHVLDMGTGSGIGAIFAADIAQYITALDINPEAVRCATINAMLNRVEGRVRVCESDLFAAVQGQQFDVVLFNPPFYTDAPRDDYDHAWRGENVFARFANALPHHLKPDGFALLVFSSDGEEAQLMDAFAAANLTVKVVATRDVINEIMTVYRISNG